MLPELGVWDKNSANGMAGAIASTMVLDIMILARTTAGINKTEAAGAAHVQIKFSDALRRVLPTTLASRLQLHG